MITVEERLASLEAWRATQEVSQKPQGFDWTPLLAYVPSKFQALVAAVLMALAGSGAWYTKPPVVQKETQEVVVNPGQVKAHQEKK